MLLSDISQQWSELLSVVNLNLNLSVKIFPIMEIFHYNNVTASHSAITAYGNINQGCWQVRDQQYCVIIHTRTAGSTAGSISVTSDASTICPNCARVPQCLIVADWLSTGRSRRRSGDDASSTTAHCWSVDSFRAGSTLTLSRMSCGDAFAGNRISIISFPQFVGKKSYVKKSRALNETPSQSYGVSLAIWDHTVLPCYGEVANFLRICYGKPA